MNRQVRHVEKEGPVAVALYEIDAVFREQIGRVSLLHVNPVVVPPVLVSGPVNMRVKVPVARSQTAKQIKTLIRRQPWRMIAQMMPFAEAGRDIAAILQNFRDRDSLVRKAPVAVADARERRIENAAESLRILSRHHGGTCRAAHGPRRMKVGESNASGSQCVDMGCRVDRTAIAANVAVPQVIRNDQYQIRPVGGVFGTARPATHQTTGEGTAYRYSYAFHFIARLAVSRGTHLCATIMSCLVRLHNCAARFRSVSVARGITPAFGGEEEFG